MHINVFIAVILSMVQLVWAPPLNSCGNMKENKELDHIATKIASFLLRSYSSNYFIKAMDRIFLGVYWHNKTLRYWDNT